MSEWQTIDSAPRDGSKVRIYFDDDYQDERYWSVNDRGWCKDVGWPVAHNYRFAKATHWQPITKP